MGKLSNNVSRANIIYTIGALLIYICTTTTTQAQTQEGVPVSALQRAVYDGAHTDGRPAAPPSQQAETKDEAKGEAKGETPLFTSNDTTTLRPLFAAKTNLLFDALTALNVELEVPIGQRWSVAGEWIFPWWVTKDNGNALQILSGNVEGKYWFGDRTKRPVMTGWFAGLYAGGGLYDLQYRNNGYQGEFYIAAGVSGGFAHTINKSGTLRMEYSLGIGYLQTEYRYYEGVEQNEFLVWQYDGRYSWLGPTRAKVSLVWMLNAKQKGSSR